MTNDPIPAVRKEDLAAWKEIVAKYQEPSTGRALWQIADTLLPYAVLWYLMYLSLGVSWWITILSPWWQERFW